MQQWRGSARERDFTEISHYGMATQKIGPFIRLGQLARNNIILTLQFLGHKRIAFSALSRDGSSMSCFRYTSDRLHHVFPAHSFDPAFSYSSTALAYFSTALAYSPLLWCWFPSCLRESALCNGRQFYFNLVSY